MNSLLITLFVVTPLVVHAQTNPVLDLNNLANYSNQPVPPYITKDNTPANNPLTDAGATLGRVLFYDKQLSADNTIACASWHLQQHAFGDPALAAVIFFPDTGSADSVRPAHIVGLDVGMTAFPVSFSQLSSSGS